MRDLTIFTLRHKLK